MRSQEIPGVFLEKKSACHGVLTATKTLLWSSCSVLSRLVAFYRVPTDFLLAILCALTTLSLRFHVAHIACTALSRRLHCAFTAFALR